MRKKRRGESPMHHQVTAVRAELHDYVDRWCDDWPAIDQWASLAIRRGGDGPERKASGHSDPTGDAVVNMALDPWNQWLDKFRNFRVVARILEGDRERLRPVSEQEKTKLDAERDVEPCARCGIPNPHVHRVDGKPYCARAFDRHGVKGEACYFIVWREQRRANEQTG